MLVGCVTDQGGSNKKNEDSVLVDLDKGLFLVADGLGGHNAGKCASSIAAEEIAAYLNENMVSDQEALPIIEQAVLHANSSIARAAEADPEWRTEMGSTVVVGFVRGNRLIVSNVGDSRAYLISNGSIEQLSQDHTFVAEWVKAGTITTKEARKHAARHGLWMALGIEWDVEPYRY